MRVINIKLDFLVEQAKSGIKKINWYDIWIGFLISTSSWLLWDTTRARAVYNIMKPILGGIKGFLGM